MSRLTVVSRKSPLALSQTGIVVAALEHVGVTCEIRKTTSAGDETSQPLADIGGKELFAGALRQALYDGSADVAVHSLKDLPAQRPSDIALLAVCFPEEPCDVFISKSRFSFNKLPAGAKVGTCSPRREALLHEYFPEVEVVAMRGNIQTRLKKMHDGACDVLILAAAGLRRLNLIDGETLTTGEHVLQLPSKTFIPAPGQGMLAVECLEKKLKDDVFVKTRATLLNKAAEMRYAAEGEFARQIGGDCHTPLGAFAMKTLDNKKDGQIQLQAFYAGDGHFRQTIVCDSYSIKGAKRAAIAAARAVCA